MPESENNTLIHGWSEYPFIAKAIGFINAQQSQINGLVPVERLLDFLDIDEREFELRLNRWLGEGQTWSTLEFIQFFSKQRAKASLKNSNVRSCSSKGLHFKCMDKPALSEVTRIFYGVAASPFGDILIAWTKVGVLHLVFIENKFPKFLNPNAKNLNPKP